MLGKLKALVALAPWRVLVIGALALSACAQPTAVPTAVPTTVPTSVPATATAVVDLGEAMDAQVSGLAEQGLFSGSVLVARGGEIILSQGYGLADRAQGRTNTPATKFRLADISKQFTAMAILILEQQGQVDLQASVCTYIPDCPAAWEPITLHQLLTFTAGLENEPLDESKPVADTTSPVEHTVLLFRDDPVQGVPGIHFYPLGMRSYVLLAYVIEQVSGQTYGEFVRQNIFDPLGMASSGWLENLDGLALRYNDTNAVAPAHDPDDAAVWSGGGGLYSTVEDLYRWDQALYTETLVPQSALDRMFSVQAEMETMQYGYGWTVTTSSGHLLYWHNGWALPGVSTTIKRYVDDDVFITVLSNQGDVDAQSVAATLTKMVLAP